MSTGLFGTAEGCLAATAAVERSKNLARAVNVHDRELRELRAAVKDVAQGLARLEAGLADAGLLDGPRTRDPKPHPPARPAPVGPPEAVQGRS